MPFKIAQAFLPLQLAMAWKVIGEYAFAECAALTSITIPKSVTSIERRAFRHCTGLTDIYYLGNEADWANITIDSGNSNFSSATVHYNYIPTPEILCGDVNGDGSVTAKDNTVLARHLANWTGYGTLPKK